MASLVALAGCGTLGSTDIANARAAYSEVIRRTDDEQLLRMIVQTRYGESHSFLLVSSVTSNLSFRGTAGAQFGIGPESSFAGNLVPLSAGVAYEENPTISYVPRQGPQYMRDLLSPIGIEMLVLLIGAVDDPAWVLRLCVDQANGLRRPPGDDAIAPGAADGSLARSLELLGLLIRDRAAAIGRGTGTDGPFVLVVHDRDGAQEAAVRELLQLLGLSSSFDPTAPMLIPVRHALHDGTQPGIDLITRSPYDLLRLAAAGVEVPQRDSDANVAAPADWSVAGGASPLVVRTSPGRPAASAVAIEHRGTWFYVDDADWASKQGFLLMRVLVLARLQEEPGAGRPVLTLPVG
ncbi:MAG TPA: hypothetical protein PKC43_05665 [Phycisphaerales bacterium]|nr:hypothetical protein [Phycisphaerales bacterium]HMP36919.1 hypothetical protein [Phycisphaerales bacterium]